MKLVPDGTPKKAPVKFGEQATGNHFIKSGRGDVAEKEDPHFPTDTVAVVLYDRGTTWLAVYPKTTKTLYHTLEAM